MYLVDGKEYTDEEYQVISQRRWDEEWARRRAQLQAEEAEREEARRLVRLLGAAYTEYSCFLEARPHLRQGPGGKQSFCVPSVPGDPASERPEDQASDQLFYELLRRNLGHADDAPRCGHIKADGLRCRSPRMKTGELCYAHQRMLESSPRQVRVPAMEDPNAIQLGLMEVSRALIDRQISEKTAGLLLYALQTAAANVGRLTFHKFPQEMVIEDTAPPRPGPTRLPAATHAPGPDLSIYDDLDHDLRGRLQEISDEFDRRRAAKSASRAEESRAEEGPAEETRAKDGICAEDSICEEEIYADKPYAEEGGLEQSRSAESHGENIPEVNGGGPAAAGLENAVHRNRDIPPQEHPAIMSRPPAPANLLENLGTGTGG